METATSRKPSGMLLLFAMLLAAGYAIGSVFAMNDLWKCYVENNIVFGGFGDPQMFCNSGQMYMYFTWAALAGSLLLFFLHWRNRNSFNWKSPALIALILIGLGCYFLFIKHEPEEMRFMEYIQLRFGPFWSLTLSSFFILKCIVILGKKKS